MVTSTDLRPPVIHNEAQVVLFTDNDQLFPGYTPRSRISPELNTVPSTKISLIVVLKDEADNLPAWLASLEKQTRMPDEIVFVDGGSTDTSLQILEAFAKRSTIRIKILVEPGSNIAQARNLAVQEADHAVIACTDLGGRLRPDWLEKITAPFNILPRTQVVAGWFEVIRRKPVQMRLLGGRFDWVSPENYLPSSRTIAFRKNAWEIVSGYPEWLTRTAEDTWFAMALKQACPYWAFVPDAVVEWQAPHTIRGYWEKVRTWAKGDGEAGLNREFFRRSQLRGELIASMFLISLAGVISLFVLSKLDLLGAVFASAAALYLASWFGYRGHLVSPVDLITEIGAEVAFRRGFREGMKHRSQALERRYAGVKGIIFILAGVPLDDIGGGARCSQLTFEFLAQGYAVFYIHKFPKYETVPLNLSIHHPYLFLSFLKDLDLETFRIDHWEVIKNKITAALVEFPLPEFLPIIHMIQEAGGVVLYDLLDDWSTPLGGKWYHPAKEKEIIDASQALIATEKSLKQRLEQISQRPVSLLPNAVNRRLYNPDAQYTRPDDLPEAEWLAIYMGSMWGDWFDWELLRKVALAYPEAYVIVIGDYQGQCPEPPSNLHFLGLRPQFMLPAYLAYADVALLPRLVKPATQAMSPLKVYEYLAMHKPVVATNLLPLQNIPGVLLAKDHADFISKVKLARQTQIPVEKIELFLAEHNWTRRVHQIMELVKRHNKRMTPEKS